MVFCFITEAILEYLRSIWHVVENLLILGRDFILRLLSIKQFDISHLQCIKTLECVNCHLIFQLTMDVFLCIVSMQTQS